MLSSHSACALERAPPASKLRELNTSNMSCACSCKATIVQGAVSFFNNHTILAALMYAVPSNRCSHYAMPSAAAPVHRGPRELICASQRKHTALYRRRTV